MVANKKSDFLRSPAYRYKGDKIRAKSNLVLFGDLE